MSEPPRTDLRQHIRVFLSADLVSATEYKVRHPAEWPDRVRSVFADFPVRLISALSVTRRELELSPRPAPKIWKFNGDEVLLYDFVYPESLGGISHLRALTEAFTTVVAIYDQELGQIGMGMRGTVWTAGFPLRNRILRIRQGTSIPLVRGRELEAVDDTTGFVDHMANIVVDFVGPDLDLGFRIAGETPPGRVSCSLDVAWLLCKDPDAPDIYQVGWRRLKGVANNAPYPLLWLMNDALMNPRRPWDASDPEASPETRAFATNPSDCRRTAAEIRKLARELWGILNPYLIEPYLELPAMHVHAEVWRAGVEFPADITVGDRPFAGQWTGRTSDVLTDVLNQVQMDLHKVPGLAGQLRSVLEQIWRSTGYQEWLRKGQFDGAPYYLQHDLAFTRDVEPKWLLQRLALADYDELLVKINVADGKVFITDSLSVPGNYRVFPFDDESDHLRNAAKRLGWDAWATCVIDPATGCGHNLLRHDGNVRRYGFDVNTRALSFAAVNASLNEIPVSLLAASSVRDGIPPVFQQGREENVLLLVNMPFALPPRLGTLPVSAEGGQYGYELTLAALESIAALRGHLMPGSQLRCLQLFYSVGNLESNSWVVVDRARTLFGPDNVRWGLVDAPLWRVNGVKSEPNPMPVNRMRTRAKCRFYVRPPMTPEEVDAGYAGLEDELLERGWDHLAYGILEIEVAGGEHSLRG